MYPSFVFIRHGESVHNSRSKAVYESLKSVPNWKNTPEFLKVKFDESLIDGSVTKQGEIQAQFAKKSINFDTIDIVVVSPLRRALETCDIIFGDRQDIKVFVEPFLSQMLCSAVDIGGRIKESRQIYGKKFDFSRIPQENQERWYLQNLMNEQKKKMVLQKAEKDRNYSSATIQMLKIAPLQGNIDFEKRIKLLKQQLLKYKHMSNKKVALVGHSYTFRFLTASGFFQNGEPINDVMLNNCQVREIPIIIEGYHEQEESVVPFCKIP